MEMLDGTMNRKRNGFHSRAKKIQRKKSLHFSILTLSLLLSFCLCVLLTSKTAPVKYSGLVQTGKMNQTELDEWLRTQVDPDIIRAAAHEVHAKGMVPDGFLAAVKKILDVRKGRTCEISIEGPHEGQPRKLSLKAIKIIAKAIMQSDSVTSVTLYHCGIDDNLAEVLFAALRSNHSVTDLNLGWNSIGSRGYLAMVEMLKHNTTLSFVNLYENYSENGGRSKFVAIEEHMFAVLQQAAVDRGLDDPIRIRFQCHEFGPGDAYREW